MKCNGEDLLARRRLSESYREVGCSFLSFLDMSTGDVIYRMCGFAKKRLGDLFNTSKDELHDLMDRMAGMHDTVEETAGTALFKMKMDFEMIGFDFDAETARHLYDDPFDRTWHSPKKVQQHRSRAEFVAAMELPTQTYYASILNYMHLHKGFGKGRLPELYAALRADYNLFIGAYLRCDDKSDAMMTRMIRERQDRIEKMGVDTMEIDRANGMPIEAKLEEPAKTSPAKIPAGMEHLTWDALKNTNNCELIRKVY